MKKWRDFLRDRTVTCTAFAIFFLCILLPITVLGSIWGNRMWIEETSRYQQQKQAQSQQIASGIQQQFDEINRTATNILLSRWLSRLNNHIGLYSEEFDVFERNGIVQDLATQAAAFYFISDIIVSVPNSELVVSTKGWFDENSFGEYHDIELNEQVQEMSSQKYLLLPVSSLSPTTTNCTIYMEIDFAEMLNFVQNLSLGEFSSISIQQGETSLCTWGERPPENVESSFELGPFAQNLTVSFYYPSSPPVRSWSPIILALAVFGLLCGSAAAAAALALITTKPLTQILKKLPPSTGRSGGSYWRLSSDIDNLIHNNEYLLKKLNHQLEQYEQYEKRDALFQILTLPPENAAEYIYTWIPWYHLNLPYQVLLFQQKVPLVKKTLDVINAILVASMERVISFSMPSTDGIYFAWFRGGEKPDDNQLIPKEFFEEYAFAVSDRETDCWKLRDCYHQAKKRLDVQQDFKIEKTHWISLSAEMNLIHAIQSGKANECEKIIEKYRLLANQEIMDNLMVLLLRLASEYGFCAQSYSDRFHQGQLLHRADVLHRVIHDLYTDLCQFIQNAKQSNSSETALLVQEYVRDNFTNPEMSLKLLAEVFQSNASLLSKLFKNQLQVNFSDYLQQIRMEHAKEMLVNTDMPVSQIADKIGYDSYLSFKRAFIRVESISPKEYREQQISG